MFLACAYIVRWQAAIACQDSDENVKQVLYQMNHANDVYKTASKHVRLHAQTPKPAGKSKAKAASKKGFRK